MEENRIDSSEENEKAITDPENGEINEEVIADEVSEVEGNIVIPTKADEESFEDYDPFDDYEETSLEEEFSLFDESEEEAPAEVDTLSAMLYDSDDEPVFESAPEDDGVYKEFLKDYREMIALSLASNKKEPEISIKEENEFLEYHVENYANTEKDSDESKGAGTDYTFQDFKKNRNKHRKLSEESASTDIEWSDDITLLPAEYEELCEEEDTEEEEAPAFDTSALGSRADDDFQLTINFDGEEYEEPAVDEDTESDCKYDPEKPRLIDSIFDFVELFAFTLVAVMLLTTFCVRHAIVDGPSMMNTLEDGDYLLISNLFYTPERDDIIVFEDYSTSLKKAVVKRVIGIAGDTVEVKLITENTTTPYYEVYVNGTKIPDTYAYNSPGLWVPNTGVWEVHEGELFVMGDNRFNSTDSRSDSVGTIDENSVLGKVILRFFPFDKFGGVK